LYQEIQECKADSLSLPVGVGRRLSAYLALIRPYQWIKNLLVFAPVYFAGRLADPCLIKEAIGAGFLFCIAASIGYVINDWRDRKEDRNHPEKCKRPFASGVLKKLDGFLIGVILLALFFITLFFFKPTNGLIICILAYLLVSLSYSFFFKNIVLLEIFIVSSFFLIRVIAGGLATGIHISNWLFSTVFFLALLITIAKRKSEILVVGLSSKAHRESLGHYSIEFLNLFLWSVAGVSLVTYALYTVENDHNLVLSIMPATYGIVRFLYVTDSGKGGDPILTTIRDPHLLVCTIGFLLFICYKIYG